METRRTVGIGKNLMTLLSSMIYPLLSGKGVGADGAGSAVTTMLFPWLPSWGYIEERRRHNYECAMNGQGSSNGR